MMIVGIGASAGGLAAVRGFLGNLPPESGLAVVVVGRVAPDAKQDVAAELRGRTSVPVIPVTADTPVTADHVYVAPADGEVVLEDGVLRVLAVQRVDGARAPIDRFFRSLAAHGKDACAVVLSGDGVDGTLGLKAVKEEGGFTIAQDPADAEHDGMPRSAIATGFVDLVAPIDEIATRIVAINRTRDAYQLDDARAPPGVISDALRDILTLVRIRSGHDFSLYKRPTLLRRVARRMQVCQAESISDYLTYLREHPGELGALLRDFLISVTNFFRDPPAFEVLATQVIPRLFTGKDHAGQVRVWIPGCATGEEAYSIAMLCAEHAARLADAPQIQVFATDIDDDAIQEARAGRYPETIATDVPAARLDRHFTREGAFYRVKKDIRELVLFSSHNVLRDPPFSKLDLISCRNLLIYLNREAQDRILGIFHFALRPDGYLFLGSSESAEAAPALFAPSDPKHRIYVRRAAAVPVALATTFPSARWHVPAQPSPTAGADRPVSFGELHHRMVEAYAPPSVVINEELDVVHVSEHAGRYLEISGGEPTRNLLQLAHEGLRLDLRAAIYAARRAANGRDRRRVRVTLGGQARIVEITVCAFDSSPHAHGMMLVVFDERDPAAGVEEDPRESPSVEPVVRQLEEELHRTREQLRATVEQYETSVEELKASNEELHAINEELRSATEELETSKEELQSVNEELTTLNHELNDKVEEVRRANSDLQNLMTSTEIAVLFLDRKLDIKRFTPRARDLFNVIPSDIGRPLAHVTHRLQSEELPRLAAEVLQTLRPIERDMTSVDGRSYLVRLHPYRSMEDRIDGVVLTFLDVTALEEAEHTARARATMLELAERAADAGMWEIDASRAVLMSAECRRLHGILEEADAATLAGWVAHIHRFDRNGVERALVQALEQGEEINVEYRVQHPQKGQRWLWATGRAEERAGRRAVAGVTIDITDRRRTEGALRASEERFRLALRTAPVMMLQQDVDLRYTWGYMQGGPVDFIGKTDLDLFPRDEAERLIALKREVLRTGVGHREEVALTIGGATHYYDLAIEPIRQEGAGIVGISSAAADVTSSKLAEMALRDEGRRKDDFLATLAHELRNPLTPLLAAVDIQQLAGGDLETIEKARVVMERQLAQIIRLVDDLLDMSRITHGKIQLRVQRVALQDVVHAALDTTRALVEQAGHHLDVILPAERIEIDGDSTRLIQIVTNLVSNAVKFTPSGGTIRLAAEAAGDWVTLRVRDTGRGIPREVLPHVFDMFSQGDEGSGGGLGIGLALVRRLVELHGGTVEAHSEGVGKGSELVVRLPRQGALARAAAPVDRSMRGPGRPRRVLVVDDSRDATAAISELLRLMGHEARTAEDGPAALAAFDAFRPEVVLLDLGMPGMDGYEVARRIRGKPGGAGVMIVAVTGWGQPEDRARTATAGFDRHLVKPAGLVALRALVGDASGERVAP